ncbi:CD209 antigen-like protein C [Notothenia coriiceps]|uniref:CD209 antigen-like protein C n=1 Tax=Notothenia coriiceps TaxID=8208 RepID=A0A6I9Q5K4_9TELE|nr:PREDICTED: CD209 antigen-like protein C [Notothenia coriiceps]
MEGLVTKDEIFSHPASGDPMQSGYVQDRPQSSDNNSAAERKQLETRLTNLTTEKDQLHQSYDSVTAERDELKREHNQLETNHNILRREKGELLKKIDKITARPCQTGWSKFDISCYFVSSVFKNWTSSRQECIDQGADLVVIDSLEEQEFLNMLMQKDQNAWIGLTDSLKEGTWMWVDGRNVTTKFWQPGQPNSYNGNQDCGENIQKTTGVGQWNDDGCFAVQNWICEK